MRVRAELRRHGLEGMLVEECLDAFPDWISQLRRAQHKKFGARLAGSFADKDGFCVLSSILISAAMSRSIRSASWG